MGRLMKEIGRRTGLAILPVMLLGGMLLLAGCGAGSAGSDSTAGQEEIETALNLANIGPAWQYDSESDAWVMSPVTAVTKAQIEDEQGVSVCIPGAYVQGIDTDGDGSPDVTEDTASVTGVPIIDDAAQITSSNGQVYTAATAPVIINTGAAGYSEQQNPTAATSYAAEGYINVACGNRGKQSTYTDEDGNEVYTGDAPCCLVDQKNAVRFVKYNILLGNLPGSIDYFVSTGGSGGGAHAAMLAATSDNPDYYPYEAAAGAVGVYEDGDSYITTVTIDGSQTELSDGMWGCMAYSAITSLQEADMALAFEYDLDTDYDFNTGFQKQLAAGLSREYMDYINGRQMKVEEEKVGFDLNGDGKTDDTVDLTIEYDADKYADTNGYGGTYLDLYLAEFQQSLAQYLERLAYTEDWTWFDADGTALSDDQVADMSTADKAQAFLEGRVAVGTAGNGGRADGGDFGGRGGKGGKPDGDFGGKGGKPDGNFGEKDGNFPGPGGDGDGDVNGTDGLPDMTADQNGDQTNDKAGEAVGTPDAGTTQSAGSSTDSANYDSYANMLQAYQDDIASIQEGDAFGNNIVSLYDPIQYIGADATKDPTWTRILCGAAEGDISMMNSLNLQIAWLSAGTDASIEWQWNGGHVPSEILGDSLPLYVDMMYGKYVDGAVSVEKAKAQKQTSNGDAEEPTVEDISGWVSYDAETGAATFSLADAAAYRVAGASKAMPGFDVIDYGQEDYEFGSAAADARHWDSYVLQVLEDQQESLQKLFNAGE